ncbi:MAG: GDSL-type esterase/lipase family protein, partial [Candidatus Aminicenantes bacterium]|nr:GDSL-type esterase/lipase family protein [Candidatus Aminicenantes bacterium]
GPFHLRPSVQAGTPGPEKTIAVLGSSVAAGWVTSRETKHDMANGYAQRLGRLLGPRGFKVVNISVPGDTTEKVLARLEKDLLPIKPDFVLIALSLENEGIRGLWGKDSGQVYAGFKAGLRGIIDRCREHGIVPVLGSCYPNDNFTQPAHYASLKAMNLEIGTWAVPSINLLGALDNGDGQFVPGIAFDLDHPADLGHRELFHSVVPSLFQALAAGTPLPVKETGSGFTALGKTGSNAGVLSHVPADPVHSFTSVLEFYPRSKGVLTATLGLDGTQAVLSITAEGDLVYRSTNGATKIIRTSFLDQAWHQLGIVHHGLKNETIVYVDGIPGAAVAETLRPVQFTVGGAESAPADCRDWMIFRAPLNADEMKAVRSGTLLQSSLEVYAPLREEILRPNHEAVNRAQSLAKVIASPVDEERDIARLRAAWQREEESEKTFLDPREKKAVPVAREILEACVGTYDGPPGLVLTVETRGNRLLLQLNGGRDGTVELLPLSPERYFVKSAGPEIEVLFSSVKNEDGRPASLILKIDKQEIPAKRK